MGKVRVDQLLVNRGCFESREQAKRAVMAGLVFSEGRRLDKPGTAVDVDVPIDVKGNAMPFVSRGGLKLEKALEEFHLSVEDKVVLDIGASTGGFTDCVLQHGAAKVYAVDVGYGQLHWKLRNDSRVVVMERTNVRHLKPDDLPERSHLATIDVAFISLTKFFQDLLPLLVDEGQIVALIKPQFEAGRQFVGKKGVVHDPKVHVEVLQRVGRELQHSGAGLQALTYSPIRGPQGNIEYLALLKKGEPIMDASAWSERIVSTAHADSHLTRKGLG